MSAITNIFKQIKVRREAGLSPFVRGLFLAPLWQIYKRFVGLPLMIRTYRSTNLLLRPNCVTSSRFIYEGRPDEYYVRILAAFADQKTSFIDVGGNVGLYTILLCNDFQNGWLLEPNPVAARMAQHNIAINDAGDRFKVIEAAAGSKNGFAKFPVLDTPLTTAHVGGKHEGKTVDVQVLRLDRFLRADQSFVVKVDAEGTDADVLAGLYDFFRSGSIKICLFECHTDNTLNKVKKLMSQLDYSIMDRETKVYPREKAIAKRSRDLFLVRNDLVSHYLQVVTNS